jgi:chromosome segregation ATPase
MEDLQKENDDLKMRLFGARLEIRKLKLQIEEVKNSLKQQQDNIQNGDNQRQYTTTIHNEPDDGSAGGGGG